MFGEYYTRPYWFAGVGGWPTFRPSVRKGFVDVAAEAGGEGDEFFGMRGQEVLVDAGFVVEAVPVCEGPGAMRLKMAWGGLIALNVGVCGEAPF